LEERSGNEIQNGGDKGNKGRKDGDEKQKLFWLNSNGIPHEVHTNYSWLA
jgi:hypothetical protein